MGQIFLARLRGIEGFERLVVIKRIRPEVAQHEQTVAMFVDEIRLLSSIQHSNVVHIYDVGVTQGGYFYVMEFLHGQDLGAVARTFRPRGGVPAGPAIAACMGALSGLHHVHERRGADGVPLEIVHRDISPSNIFVTYDGQVKLLDFGIAKSAARTTNETDVGTVKGKFRYMSPEQVRQQPVDRRTDLYSVGVVLWELTTGTVLHKGQSDIQTLVSVMEKTVPAPSTIRADFPKSLEAVIMRALDRDPDKRFQTAAEMQLALEATARELGVSLSPASLVEFMSTTFAADIAAWNAAQIEGRDLARHVADTWKDPSASGTPVSQRSPLPPSGEKATPVGVKSTGNLTPVGVKSTGNLTPVGVKSTGNLTPLSAKSTGNLAPAGSKTTGDLAAAVVSGPSGLTPASGSRPLPKPTTGSLPPVPVPADPQIVAGNDGEEDDDFSIDEASSPRSLRVLVGIVAGLVLLVAIGLIWRFTQESPQPQPPVSVAPVAPVVPVVPVAVPTPAPEPVVVAPIVAEPVPSPGPAADKQPVVAKPPIVAKKPGPPSPPRPVVPIPAKPAVAAPPASGAWDPSSPLPPQ
jgi:serine/threonine protein kinase